MYQVIARKYRPQSFQELIGQEHVQKTLTNAIETGRIAHGYIFSGQRGTGKTTVARILARCLNCINGPTGTPCGICSSCTEIAAGNSVDVIEIDAASNRGINEMREIRENVRYRPARDRYKIFIIDEAHQITKEAFNALLKTLEEPPQWVVFVLCTTEAYDIPNTIVSRCQHFTFRSVAFDQLVERIKFIAEQEGIQTDEETLSVIARAGEGSVRDSLSALDQAIACCGHTLCVADIRALLGVFGAASLRAVADAVHTQDAGRMIEIVQELENNGQSLQHFCRELSRYWRNLLVSKISGKFTRLIAASEPEQKDFLDTASGFSEEDLTRYLNLVLELYKSLQNSLQPRLHLELGLVKLVQAGKLRSIEDALSSLDSTATAEAPASQMAGPRSPVTGAPPLTAATRSGGPRPSPFQAPSPRIEKAVASSNPPPPQPSVSGSSEGIRAGQSTGNLQQDMQDDLRAAGMAFSADAIAQADISVRGSEVLIRAPNRMMMALRDAAVQKAATRLLGLSVKVRLESDEAVKAEVPQAVQQQTGPPPEEEVRSRALGHPAVQRFQQMFPDARVSSVRNLKD